MVTVIDYGIGNLRSIEKAFAHVGVPVVRTDDVDAIARAERLVLPGVGAFGACMDEVRARGLEAPIKDAVDRGVPFLGVCVGMQMLFGYSEEQGRHTGLGLMPGHVEHFSAQDGLKIPHMGWNRLALHAPAHPLFTGLPADAYFYFVHSYHATDVPADAVLASCTYGRPFPAIVGRNNVWGVQFHPEKSHTHGLRILQNFALPPCPPPDPTVPPGNTC